MVDNLKIKQPQDPKTINTHEVWEMNYWSKELGVSKEKIMANELQTAIKKTKSFHCFLN